jgi:hypothetical protein
LHNFVELKFSKISFKKLFFMPTTLIVILAGCLPILQNGVVSEKNQKVFAAFSDRSPYRCGKLVRITDPKAISCELTTGVINPKLNILLVGNSHADTIKSEFMEVAKKNYAALYFMIPNNPLMKGGLSPESIINNAIKKDIDVIALHFNTRPVSFLSNVIKLNDLAKKNNIKMTLIEPVPEWEVHIPKAMFLGEEPKQTKSEYLDKNSLELTGYESINSFNLRIVLVADVFCQKTCQFKSSEGKPLYFDSGHLTLTGASMLNQKIENVIKFYLL